MKSFMTPNFDPKIQAYVVDVDANGQITERLYVPVLGWRVYELDRLDQELGVFDAVPILPCGVVASGSTAYCLTKGENWWPANTSDWRRTSDPAEADEYLTDRVMKHRKAAKMRPAVTKLLDEREKKAG